MPISNRIVRKVVKHEFLEGFSKYYWNTKKGQVEEYYIPTVKLLLVDGEAIILEENGCHPSWIFCINEGEPEDSLQLVCHINEQKRVVFAELMGSKQTWYNFGASFSGMTSKNQLFSRNMHDLVRESGIYALHRTQESLRNKFVASLASLKPNRSIITITCQTGIVTGIYLTHDENQIVVGNEEKEVKIPITEITTFKKL